MITSSYFSSDDSTSQPSTKKPRVFFLSDEQFKTLCHADKKSLDPTQGLENLIHMYLSLTGPLNFTKIDLERALLAFKKYTSLQQNIISDQEGIHSNN
jgi:hypothetical protein